MKYAIDGTTGLLGRNLLFEILKQNLNCLDDIEIVIFGKGTNGTSLESRMNEIILEDGLNYLNLDKNSEFFNQIKSRIIYIEFDLTMPCLGISKDNLELLKKIKINYFYHIAALSSFFDTPEITKKLNQINIDGTKHILDLIKEISVDQFVFVSSAYHSGSSIENIKPDFINETGRFRNPYERTKLEAEIYLNDFAKKIKLNHSVFRITTICGRLIENEIGSINKYDVFYGWGLYFLKLKLKLFKNSDNVYTEPYEIKLRIHSHPENTMNIIPADYGAKLLLHTSHNAKAGDSFHLKNDTEFNTKTLINNILLNLNIYGHCFVENEPDDKSTFEQLYYRSVGKIFTPYIIDPPLNYINDNLKNIEKKYNLKCPEMNEENFQKLLDYAQKHNFGIEMQ